MKYLCSALIACFYLSAFSQTNNNEVEQMNEFTVQLYQKLTEDNWDKNGLFSPYSIQQAMAMAYFGANNETKKEMQKTLHFNQKKELVNKNFHNWNTALQIKSDSINFIISNALFVQKQYKFFPGYFNEINNNYMAKVSHVDFSKAKYRNKATNKINHWVANNTNNNINELLSADDLNELTRLVITNAVWLKANWLKAFNTQKTIKKDFENLDGLTSKVDMMHQKSEFKYFEDKTIQAIELPYQGKQFTMIVLLPKTINYFSETEKRIEPKTLAKIEQSMREATVNLQLPKFNTQSEFYLKETLKEMGMPTAFSNNADFSSITGKTDLRIDKVIHKANIEVSESGAEASAATAVVMVRKSALARNIQFYANRPFIYLIKHNKTGLFLFVGRYVNCN